MQNRLVVVVKILAQHLVYGLAHSNKEEFLVLLACFTIYTFIPLSNVYLTIKIIKGLRQPSPQRPPALKTALLQLICVDSLAILTIVILTFLTTGWFVQYLFLFPLYLSALIRLFH